MTESWEEYVAGLDADDEVKADLLDPVKLRGMIDYIEYWKKVHRSRGLDV